MTKTNQVYNHFKENGVYTELLYIYIFIAVS